MPYRHGIYLRSGHTLVSIVKYSYEDYTDYNG